MQEYFFNEWFVWNCPDFCVEENSCLSEDTDVFCCIHDHILIGYSTVQGKGLFFCKA